MGNIRIEIRNLETDEWQWLGLLNEELLTELTEYADKLNDRLPPNPKSKKGKEV